MPGGARPNLIAVDLGGESCRISLLEWSGESPRIRLVHRFNHAPVPNGTSLLWNFERIVTEVRRAIEVCASQCSPPPAAVGVDGWAVDYVRIDEAGIPIGPPHCYRDQRTVATFAQFHERTPAVELYKGTGVQPVRINTLYQLLADRDEGVSPGLRWVCLPEYLLMRLGGRCVAEFTNATHTGMVDLATRDWSKDLLRHCGFERDAAPEMVPPGTDLGHLCQEPGGDAALAHMRLIVPACHDTASAVAGIPLEGEDWAYISSGTWSLAGCLIDAAIATPAACTAGFTNLGAAGDRICFHRNVNGMWLLRETMRQLLPGEDGWPVEALVQAAEALPAPQHLLDVDAPELLLPGSMATRINAQRIAGGLDPIEEQPASLPDFASLIFHSLAHRYATVLRDCERLTGRRFSTIAVVGGGSLNRLLNRLTAEATGLNVLCGAAESATIGNFAVQLATLEGCQNSASRIAHWARVLCAVQQH
jgi:rhamnulokinase